MLSDLLTLIALGFLRDFYFGWGGEGVGGQFDLPPLHILRRTNLIST